MSLADDMFDFVMSTFNESGAVDARSQLATYYDLLRQDHKLRRISEEEYQRSKAVILEVRDRLEVEIARAEGREVEAVGVEARPVAKVET